MFAVTGITGKVGSQVARSLLARGQTVRAVVRNREKGDEWAALGCEVSLASVGDADALIEAFRGVEGVFLMTPPDYDPEPDLGKIKTRLFALNFGDDEFNPDELKLLETLTPRVRNGRYVVQPGTPDSFGHLTMAHPELWSGHVAEFMHELGD